MHYALGTRHSGTTGDAEKREDGDFREDASAAKSPSIPSPRRRLYEPEAFTKGGRF